MTTRHRPLTPAQQRTLTKLANAYGDLIDAYTPGNNARVLDALTRKQLAKRIDTGLYRITLAGLNQHRHNTTNPPNTHPPHQPTTTTTRYYHPPQLALKHKDAHIRTQYGNTTETTLIITATTNVLDWLEHRYNLTRKQPPTTNTEPNKPTHQEEPRPR